VVLGFEISIPLLLFGQSQMAMAAAVAAISKLQKKATTKNFEFVND